MKKVISELKDYIECKSVIDTHSHHYEDNFFQGLDLDKIFKDSYVNWCGIRFGNDLESRRNFLDRVRYNSYYVWLEKSIREIYNIESPITSETWDDVSARIKSEGGASNHLGILKDICRYDRIILDAYWRPGSDNSHPSLFAPTFRINMFLNGYDRETCDHNGNNPRAIFGIDTGNIDEYVDFIYRIIVDKKEKGCIALKSALAYDRSLDFTRVSRAEAQKALDSRSGHAGQEEIKAFGDYVFFEICRIAAELDLPLQCHTGLGRLEKTNALQLLEVIRENPGTRFILFHCGYPWMDDILALTHNFGNVYPDLCWLPIISTSAAVRMTEELIEVGTIDRICWGCDAWTSEESYGALLAVKDVLVKALSAKIQDGYLSIGDAKIIIDRILHDNAKQIYKL